MRETLRIHCDALGRFVDLPKPPRRIVSLVSSLTEALFELEVAERLVGVSSYCPNYVAGLTTSIVGDYLSVDEVKLREVEPDLILTTTGVQRQVGRRLAEKGWPVYVFPLPNSLHGILENLIVLGGLVGKVQAARELSLRWQRLFLDLQADAPATRPRVYAECWFGRHPRVPGGMTFIHDLIQAAGGENIFGHEPQAYLPLDLDEALRRRPQVMLLYSEPEYPLQAQALLQERGWNVRVIESTVTPGRNLIHDGPSMMQTALWLHEQLRASRP